MIRHETQIRVRYSETDQMGYVYYGNYAQYYEIARVETMRAAGIRYADLEREYGIWLPVISMNVRYLRPAAYDDLLTLRTFVHPIEGSQLRFDTEVFNETDKLLNSARVTLCFVDAVTRKRTSAPEWIIQKLAGPFEQESC